jgi:hypothetical protein
MARNSKHLRRFGAAMRVIVPVLGAYAAMNLGSWARTRTMNQLRALDAQNYNDHIRMLQEQHAIELANARHDAVAHFGA